MRTVAVWGLSSALLLGLATSAVRADDREDDTPRPAAKTSNGNWFTRLFGGGGNNAEAKTPSRQQRDSSKKEDTSRPLTMAETSVAVRAREKLAWERRQLVCDKLRQIAEQTNDDELLRKVEQLHHRIWAVYEQHTASLFDRPAPGPQNQMDEEILERHLGPAAARERSLGLAPANPRGQGNGSAAVREENR
jgi:hypothetical protein